MKDFPKFQEIQQHQSAQKRRIYDAFAKAEAEDGAAKLISKADFQENYPLDQYELYSLASMQKLREDMMKSEDYSDEAFRDLTKGMEHFVVQHEGKSAIVFARKKEAFESGEDKKD